MAHMKFGIDVLSRFCKDAFVKFGFTAEDKDRRGFTSTAKKSLCR